MLDLQLAALSQRRACPLGSKDLAFLEPASPCRLESLGFWGGPEAAGRGCSRDGAPKESCWGRCHDRSRRALVSGSDARCFGALAGQTQPARPLSSLPAWPAPLRPLQPPSLSSSGSRARPLGLGPECTAPCTRSPTWRAVETPGAPWARPCAGEGRPPPTGPGQGRRRGPEDGTR